MGKQRKDFAEAFSYTLTSPTLEPAPMNAPLPDSIRQALERATLDDCPLCGQRRSHRYTAGCAAARGGFGVERVSTQEH